MTKQQLEAVVFSRIRFSFTTLIKILDRRGIVIKCGYSCGRVMIVKCNDRFFTIYDGAHDSYMILETAKKDLQSELDDISEFKDHEWGYVKLKNKCLFA